MKQIEEAQIAKLRVSATLDGQAMGFYAYEVVVEDVETRIIIAKSDPLRDVLQEWELPPQRVRVVARGVTHLHGRDGSEVEDRCVTHEEKIVELLPGVTVDVTFELAPGGFLQLTLAGSADESDRLAMDAVRSGELHFVGEEDKFARRSWATVSIVGPLSAGREIVTRSEGRTDQWALGETHDSLMLPPGTFTLRAELPGGRRVERAVTIVQGETAQATLRFGP